MNTLIVADKLVCMFFKQPFIKAQARELVPVKFRLSHGFQIKAAKHRLQSIERYAIGGHGVGKDEHTTGLENTRHFAQHGGTIARMQHGVLRPDDIEMFAVKRSVLKIALNHAHRSEERRVGKE